MQRLSPAELLMLDGKRAELEELFSRLFPGGKIQEMADALWNFALEKFKREQMGAVYLAFLECVDRQMLSVIARAKQDGTSLGQINPTTKNKIINPFD